MDKIERDGRNKALYKCHFDYILSKLIVDNGPEDLLRKIYESINSSESHATMDLLTQDLQYAESILI